MSHSVRKFRQPGPPGRHRAETCVKLRSCSEQESFIFGHIVCVLCRRMFGSPNRMFRQTIRRWLGGINVVGFDPFPIARRWLAKGPIARWETCCWWRYDDHDASRMRVALHEIRTLLASGCCGGGGDVECLQPVDGEALSAELPNIRLQTGNWSIY